MIYSCLTSSRILWSHPLVLPRTFLRCKSITAAIERGRQDGPLRPFRPRTRIDHNDESDGPVKTRRELRFEEFGAPRDDAEPSSRERWTATPHSSSLEEYERPSKAERRQLQHKAKFEARLERAQSMGKTGISKWSPDALTKNGNLKRPWRQKAGRSGSVDQGVASREQSSEDRPRRQWTDNGSDSRSDDQSSYTPRTRNAADRRASWMGRGSRRGDNSASYSRRTHNTADGGSFSMRRGARRDGDSTSSSRQTHDTADEGSFSMRLGARRDDDSTSDIRQSRDSGNDRPRFTHRPDSKAARREGYEQESSDARYRTRGESEVEKTWVRGPESLPYTTAASEFIYGYNSVVSAIKAQRRKFYNLYVHARGASRDVLMSRIRAQNLFSITHEVGDEYMRALDKASSGRPHNGLVLEASPLPVPLITELKTASIEDESFSVALDNQSAEDVLVNGKQELYSYKSGGWRHPLMLYVDGVVDEGNLGAIARSAYVLGADAIITPTHHTANWSHIAVKASAGAAEALPLFKVAGSFGFLKKSASAGWCIYASDAVPSPPSMASSTVGSVEAEANKVVYSVSQTRKRLDDGHSPVAEHPTILMMGAEGTGLKTSLVNLARFKVGIPHGRESNEVGVDSLNVSVAASILCYEMLQKPKTQLKREPENVLF